MTDRNPDRFVAKILDEALHDYAKNEPPLGLEQRILTRLQRDQSLRKRRRLASVALALAASLVIAVVMLEPMEESPRPSGKFIEPVTSTGLSRTQAVVDESVSKRDLSSTLGTLQELPLSADERKPLLLRTPVFSKLEIDPKPKSIVVAPQVAGRASSQAPAAEIIRSSDESLVSDLQVDDLIVSPLEIEPLSKELFENGS